MTLTKVNKYTLNLGNKVFNFGSDQFKVALTDTAPTVSTMNQYSDITSPLASTNLSGATPLNITTTSFTQTSGVSKLIFADLTLTATGVVPQYRYVVLYSDTATNKEVLGYFDRGNEINMIAGDQTVLDFDQTNGVLTIS